MNCYISTAIGLLIFSSCTNTELESDTTQVMDKSKQLYSNDLGDIAHDPEFDRSDFVICDSTRTMQGRSRLSYPGGVSALEELCLTKFQYKQEFGSYTGYVMIRFMINCENETGRFRAKSLELDFSLKECPSELTNHLLSITKNLNGWEKSSRE